jgi:hypothetical protein
VQTLAGQAQLEESAQVHGIAVLAFVAVNDTLEQQQLAEHRLLLCI